VVHCRALHSERDAQPAAREGNLLHTKGDRAVNDEAASRVIRRSSHVVASLVAATDKRTDLH